MIIFTTCQYRLASESILVYAYILMYCFKNRGFCAGIAGLAGIFWSSFAKATADFQFDGLGAPVRKFYFQRGKIFNLTDWGILGGETHANPQWKPIWVL